MKISDQIRQAGPRQAAGYSEALKLREQIRDMEPDVQNLMMRSRLEAYLPSEDHIMDNPRKFNAKLKSVLKKLEKVKKGIEEYSKLDISM
jgi:predicted  nucleic acid-binding Zn-ribbon protein